MFDNYVDQLIETAIRAGKLIMEIYEGEIDVEIKDDNSPVTKADIIANELIVKKLKEISDIPIIAEEFSESENKLYIDEDLFWLVDPLDGTKSFISRTGEFTVNIALVKNGFPIGGVIYLPAQDICYYTKNNKSYKLDDKLSEIKVKEPENIINIVASKSHLDKNTEEFISRIKNKNIISAASSLKLCKIAEGSADIYPRFAPTMCWDIAAGQAILEHAGGHVVDLNKNRFNYNKLKNEFFIAYSNLDINLFL